MFAVLILSILTRLSRRLHHRSREQTMGKKLADMTPIEVARYRALAARRAARWTLLRLRCVERPDRLSPELRETMESTIAWAQAILAATRPGWVKKASRDELVHLFRHLSEQ